MKTLKKSILILSGLAVITYILIQFFALLFYVLYLILKNPGTTFLIIANVILMMLIYKTVKNQLIKN